ncbi:hypothetical protein [Fusobacterium sp.]|uniref:COG1470 family protein n=1 Tax=Fusobacterium sp. TaxID=68766 RepID=UPI00396CFF8A
MRKYVFLLIFFFINLNSYSLNFSVSPTKFEIDMEKVKTYTLEIKNNTGIPLRLTVNFEKKEGYEDMSDNIVVFPKKISIKPGGKKELRFTVRNLEKLQKGKYKNLFILREIVPTKGKESVYKDKDLIFNLNIITEIALPIYGVKK